MLFSAHAEFGCFVKSPNTRRAFGEIFGIDAPSLYRKMLIDYGPSAYLEKVFLKIPAIYFDKPYLLVEGLFNIEEVNWIKRNFHEHPIVVVFFIAPKDIRINRLVIRKCLSIKDSKLAIAKSDTYRNTRGLLSIKEKSDYIINNDGTKSNLLENFLLIL
jgi:dephospho-CoA kinase